MICSYDNAIVTKLKEWIPTDSSLVILSPEETTRRFSIQADIKNDEPLELPFITLTRERDITIKNTANRFMSTAGMVFNSENGISDHLNAIPISINYNLNIYGRYFEETDSLAREFLFNLIWYPKLTIDIPFNESTLQYHSFITTNTTITDASDIPERLVAGQFSRLILQLSLNDAYMFSYNYREVSKIIGTEIVTKNPPNKVSAEPTTFNNGIVIYKENI